MSVLIRAACPCPVPLGRLKRVAELLLRAVGRSGAELSLLLVDDAEMAQLNATWLGRPWPTNCISFGQNTQALSGADVLGDIVISVDTAKREASEAGHGIGHRLEALLIHGLGHLLGEDHELGPEAALRMAALERTLEDTLRKGKVMADLFIDVDHVATVRKARGGAEPDPVLVAGLAELAGADGIAVHLRGDRSHMEDRDVRLLRETVKTRLALEMAATDEMIGVAVEVRPDTVTLVPGRGGSTEEGGLDVVRLEAEIQAAVARLREAAIPAALCVSPEPEQIEAARRIGVEHVMIRTERYAEAETAAAKEVEFERVVAAARKAWDLGLRVCCGHGLTYRNVAPLASVSEIDGLSIGHAVIARAVLVGIEQAVREMLRVVKPQ